MVGVAIYCFTRLLELVIMAFCGWCSEHYKDHFEEGEELVGKVWVQVTSGVWGDVG